jgi:hypothetical protein
MRSRWSKADSNYDGVQCLCRETAEKRGNQKRERDEDSVGSIGLGLPQRELSRSKIAANCGLEHAPVKRTKINEADADVSDIST